MNETIKTAIEKIKKAQETISALCDGRIRWTMSVPARPDSDPDLVISDALQAAKEALTASADSVQERERLEEALSGVLERHTQLSTDALDEVVPKLADVVFGGKK